MKRVLGIDPGIADTGFGIIDVSGSRFGHVHHGTIRTSPDLATGQRLAIIFDAIMELTSTYQPDAAAVECLYFAKNTSSALPVAQARGVVLLALHRFGISAQEYTPQSIKQALVGYGKADKRQVQEMVRVVLGMTGIPRPDHAADALAAAVCYANTSQFTAALRGK